MEMLDPNGKWYFFFWGDTVNGGIKFMKKWIMAIIVSIPCVIVLVTFFIPSVPWKKEKAKEIAEEYVQNKYNIDAEALNVSYTLFIDSAEYQVSFSDQKRDIFFDVAVPFDFDEKRCFDTYITSLVSHKMTIWMQEKVSNEWAAKVMVIPGDEYEKVEIGPGMTPEEYEDDFFYWIDIEINQKIGDYAQESEKILRIIEAIKEEGYNPEEILITYLAQSKEGIEIEVDDLENVVNSDDICKLLKEACEDGAYE